MSMIIKIKGQIIYKWPYCKLAKATSAINMKLYSPEL